MSAIKPLAVLAAALASFIAQAQAPAQPAEARRTTDRPPAEQTAPFQSTLRNYRSFADELVAAWREANDTVLRVGGWQAYGRESREALRVPAPPALRPTAPVPGAHDAHHGARK